MKASGGHGPILSLRYLPFAVLAAALLFFSAGCDRPEPPPEERPAGTRMVPPGGGVPPAGAPRELAHPLPVREPSPAVPEALPVPGKEPAAETPAGIPPEIPAAGPREAPAAPEPRPEAVPAAEPAPAAPPPRHATPEEPPKEQVPGEVSPGPVPPATAPPERPAGDVRAPRGADRSPPERKAVREKTARKHPPAPFAGGPRGAAPAEVPVWARGGEELSYRITFMGVTAGYARLSTKGRVRLGDRDAYHIRIKAWTTGTLSVLFPISETYDYYLDTETLAPVRRDSWLKKVKRPEIVLFDQEKGTITHWYGDTMEVRKQKQIPPPTFYEGVSATYYFRARGIGERSVSIRVFGGRKVYRVSTERAGEEAIPYGKGKVDTFLVKPLYKEEGGSGEKPMVGELLVWVSNDPRRVPVKLYASFTKGLEWKLVGELTSGLPEMK